MSVAIEAASAGASEAASAGASEGAPEGAPVQPAWPQCARMAEEGELEVLKITRAEGTPWDARDSDAKSEEAQGGAKAAREAPMPPKKKLKTMRV